ncbi:dephospho-CoA kinase [Campylobacter curvus]|uniref:dephospho-CoA kinase n=1 Tax=Campylobacter curvus TaxID=200 RepID=UPI0003806319|nr:dephospho-CoA kinase [Campylobacter curvus]QKF60395.1 dephospho-CoA kinase [Campylobacter curvus]UEB50533.1 dephospho-CoA kinase [Campylobacter curvus]
MSKFKHAFVITGSIGSGKSTVLNLLKLHGFSVIDADLIAHEQLQIYAEQVAAKFGDEILINGALDRKKLGNIVFNDKEKLAWLENLLHPRIKAEILSRAQILEAKKQPFFVDIPLYFERASYEKFTQVALVYAPKNLLVERVMRRNSLTRDEALRRVELQIDIEKKREMVKFVIDNSRNLANLEHETTEFIKKLKGKYDSIKV